MIRHLSRCVGLVWCCLWAAGTSVATAPRLVSGSRPPRAGAVRPATNASRAGSLHRLPLTFERNEGQTDPAVKYLSHGHGYTLFLSAEDVTLALRQTGSADQPAAAGAAAVTMRLIGSVARPRVQGEQELPGVVNYLIGNDPAKWRRGIRTYGQVRYENVYPGVDVVYHGDQQGLEFDFVLAPGADPGVIALDVQGAKPRVDDDGAVVLATPAGDVRLRKPVIYQEERGVRREIAGGYILADDRVRFSLAAYDRTEPLIIDPYVYLTYVAGSANEEIRGIGVDSAGNAYVTGTTYSSTFPTPVNFKAINSNENPGSGTAFVGKLNSTGSQLLWLTYVGSSNYDEANAIAVDSQKRAYVAGTTSGPGDFPAPPSAYPAKFLQQSGSGPAAFMFRLAADGASLEYSTVIGAQQTQAWGVAVWEDKATSSFHAFVAGATTGAACTDPNDTTKPYPSECFPIKNAYQNANHGGSDAFVMRIDPDKSASDSLVYSTFLGGKGNDDACAIAVDTDGQAYVTGTTQSPNSNNSAEQFPLKNPFQPTYGGGGDAFVTALKTDGADLVYSSYLGGSNVENGAVLQGGIAVDANKNAYVIGTTQSTDLPLKNAVQPYLNGDATKQSTFSDAFVARIGFESASPSLVSRPGRN